MRTLALLPLVAIVSCSSVGSRAPSPDARAQFERIQSLAGEWVAVEGGDAPVGSIVRYEVTSAGTAVLETLFAGEPHEMRTMYFLDGGELVLVHYCAAGNQPRMRAAPGPDSSTIHFDFDGGSNVDLEKGMHMHAATLHVVSPARLESEWTHWADGKPGGSVRFVLARSWQ